ncbi:hypothetical protein FOL47_003917 [Perkinsus chesapeaki]|uniref:Uncharacterized protein n=1 Tax=Perkinsus chesapeaki TaxID=330153 RepID=A0A7J6M5I3_PERCH|nr:hypothetical protein FOL47_003917 [Perkinsus chesapeaki]
MSVVCSDELVAMQPPEPEAARAMPIDEVRARRRQMKNREFRQYLVDAGLVEAIVKMFVGLLEADQLPHLDDNRPETHAEMGSTILTVEALEAENEELKRSIEELEGKIPQLNESIFIAKIDRTASQWWTAVTAKTTNATATTLTPKEIIAVLQPVGDALEKVKKSDDLTKEDVMGFIRALAGGDNEVDVVEVTLKWATFLSPPAEGQVAEAPDSEAVSSWWGAFFDWKMAKDSSEQA